MTMFRYRRRTAGVILAATAALALAACGNGSGQHGGGHTASPSAPADSATPNAERNQADITFAQSMIVHHQQAIEMATLAENRAASAEVKALAAKIKQAQGPEIEEMTQWLTDWGAPTPSATPTAGHDMHGGMPGMMSTQDMTALKSASGAAFDRMFLEMMIRHHQGAVQMATTEQQQGLSAAAKGLAAKIVADQNAEIAEMQSLLTKK